MKICFAFDYRNFVESQPADLSAWDKVITPYFVPHGDPWDSHRQQSMICVEDYFSDFKRFEKYNFMAQAVARSWFSFPGYQKYLMRENVNLGECFYSRVAYGLIGLVKLSLFWKKFGAQTEITEIGVEDADNYWASSVAMFLDYHHIPYRRVPCFSKIAPIGQNRPNTFLKSWLYSLYRVLKSATTCDGGLVISASPKLGGPCLAAKELKPFRWISSEISVQGLRQSLGDSCLQVSYVDSAYLRNFSKKFSVEMDWETAEANIVSQTLPGDHKEESAHIKEIWPIWIRLFFRVWRKQLPLFAGYADWVSQFIKKTRPALVIVDEDVTPFNMLLVRLAQQHRIPTAQIQHGLMGPYALMTPVRCDFIVAAGPISQQRLLARGEVASKIILGGAPHLDFGNNISASQVAAKAFYRKKNQWPADCKILVLATHPVGDRSKSDWIGNPDTPEFLAAMIRVTVRALKADGSGDWKLVIKQHPREKNSDYISELVNREGGDGFLFQFEKKMASTTLIGASDLLLCGLSSVYYEALLAPCPVFVFDRSGQRQAEFISKHSLDLDCESHVIEQIVQALKSDEIRRKRLTAQDIEKFEHFADGNKQARSQLSVILSGLAKKGGADVFN